MVLWRETGKKEGVEGKSLIIFGEGGPFVRNNVIAHIYPRMPIGKVVLG